MSKQGSSPGTTVQTGSTAIVGAGPGGLLLARLLQLSGANVTVYERDVNRAARVQGATLNLNEESGLKAIRQAGLLEAFQAAYRPGAEKLQILDRDANVLLCESGGGSLQETRPEIDRGPLRELLLDSLHPGTVVWDCQFSSLRRVGDSVQLEFKNGRIVVADLVVAADGANSKVRPYLTPIKPGYSGITIVEGTVYDSASTVPRIRELAGEGKLCVLGDGKSLFVVAKGDDSIAFYFGWKAEEAWLRASGIDFTDPAQAGRWFRREFSGWHPLWIELFDRAAVWVPRHLLCAPPDQSWAASANLTMLGDAAHVMPPYAGEGVNMAMLDALELAECLLDSAFPDSGSAIAAYEAKMRTRAAAAAAETMRFTDLFHSPEALPQIVKFFEQTGEALALG